ACVRPSDAKYRAFRRDAVAPARTVGRARSGAPVGRHAAARAVDGPPRRAAAAWRGLMLLRLAWATLTRHRSRTVLAMLGVAVSAAMLLDMVMVSSGMRESFRSLLLARGFQLRLSPKGTLPFDTDATIADASQVTRMLRALPDVETVSPVLGGQLHVSRGGK